MNLLNALGGAACSMTVSPTYQNGRFFVRGEFSAVGAFSYTDGSAFGSNGTQGFQPRGLVEVGVLF